jgi:hypothetical protein
MRRIIPNGLDERPDPKIDGILRSCEATAVSDFRS